MDGLGPHVDDWPMVVQRDYYKELYYEAISPPDPYNALLSPFNPSQRAILGVLLRNKDELVPHDRLLAAIAFRCHDHVDGPTIGGLKQQISRTRKRLLKHRISWKILSHWGSGYMLTGVD